MVRNLIVVGVVITLMAGFALAYTFLTPPRVPPVKGYLNGQEIEFIHTEASDSKVAQKLTDMKDSPVLAVPSLAQAPEAILANVYVFANGIKRNPEPEVDAAVEQPVSEDKEEADGHQGKAQEGYHHLGLEARAQPRLPALDVELEQDPQQDEREYYKGQKNQRR